MKLSLARRATAEFLGTMFLVAAVVGSGIMAERLANGNAALALLANSLATGAALFALIAALGPISGAHFNPAVSLADAFAAPGTALSTREAVAYISAQISGGVAGTLLAHFMFGVPVVSLSHHQRSGAPQLVAEFVATFGLVSIIWGMTRERHQPPSTAALRTLLTPFAVAAYITAAYWFTASTSFANPAVTIARTLTDTFSGIRPLDAPGFIITQLAGASAATMLFRWLTPPLHPENVVLPRD
jgi:glycerol uptake facilitator-like aquaporin